MMSPIVTKKYNLTSGSQDRMMSPTVTKKYNLTLGSQHKKVFSTESQRTHNSCQILHTEILALHCGEPLMLISCSFQTVLNILSSTQHSVITEGGNKVLKRRVSFASYLQNLSRSKVIPQWPWPQGILYIRYKTVDVNKGRHSRQTGSQSPKAARGVSCPTISEHSDAHSLPGVSLTTDSFNCTLSKFTKLTPFALAHILIFSFQDA